MENTTQLQEFRTIVEKSIRVQKVLFFTLGILAALLGIVFAVLYFVPINGESVSIAALIIGLCLLVAGIWIVAYYRAQNKNTLDLLFDRTHDIQDIKVIVIKRGNMGNMYALHFVDKNNAKRGVMVPSEAYAEAVRRMYLG